MYGTIFMSQPYERGSDNEVTVTNDNSTQEKKNKKTIFMFSSIIMFSGTKNDKWQVEMMRYSIVSNSTSKILK